MLVVGHWVQSPSYSDTKLDRSPCSVPWGGATVPDLQGAYNLGIWTTNFNFTPSCPSGNCTWPKYRSLGFCSQCTDVTSTAMLDCPRPTHKGLRNLNDMNSNDKGPYFGGKCRVVLPQGQPSNSNFSVSYKNGNPSSFTIDILSSWKVASFMIGMDNDTSSSLTNQTCSNIKNPLLVLAEAHLGFDNDLIKNASNPCEGILIKNVTQCSLSYCVQDYNVSITDGKAIIKKSLPDFGEFFTLIKHGQGFTCWRPSQNSSDPINSYSDDASDSIESPDECHGVCILL